jgi:DNA-binding CsgD family transcriptional regulator
VTLAMIEAGRGEEYACRELVAEGLELAHAHGHLAIVPWAHAVLGSLELSLGEAGRAIAEFERAIRLGESAGLAVRLHWGADLVEGYRNAGRRAETSRELETLDELERDARSAALRVTIARCRALLAAEGEMDEAFREALSLAEGETMRFEKGRIELSYGERLRRARRFDQAREHLQLAFDVFATLGAVAWGERVRAELRASGVALDPPPAPRTQELTPQEVRVALAVARGATNKEAAAALFLSPKTIDFHLGHVYSKLGVRSRVELARVVGGDEGVAESPDTTRAGASQHTR